MEEKDLRLSSARYIASVADAFLYKKYEFYIQSVDIAIHQAAMRGDYDVTIYLNRIPDLDIRYPFEMFITKKLTELEYKVSKEEEDVLRISWVGPWFNLFTDNNQ